MDGVELLISELMTRMMRDKPVSLEILFLWLESVVDFERSRHLSLSATLFLHLLFRMNLFCLRRLVERILS